MTSFAAGRFRERALLALDAAFPRALRRRGPSAAGPLAARAAAVEIPGSLGAGQLAEPVEARAHRLRVRAAVERGPEPEDPRAQVRALEPGPAGPELPAAFQPLKRAGLQEALARSLGRGLPLRASALLASAPTGLRPTHPLAGDLAGPRVLRPLAKLLGAAVVRPRLGTAAIRGANGGANGGSVERASAALLCMKGRGGDGGEQEQRQAVAKVHGSTSLESRVRRAALLSPRGGMKPGPRSRFRRRCGRVTARLPRRPCSRRRRTATVRTPSP